MNFALRPLTTATAPRVRFGNEDTVRFNLIRGLEKAFTSVPGCDAHLESVAYDASSALNLMKRPGAIMEKCNFADGRMYSLLAVLVDAKSHPNVATGLTRFTYMLRNAINDYAPNTHKEALLTAIEEFLQPLYNRLLTD